MPTIDRNKVTAKLTDEQSDFYRLIRTKCMWQQPWLAASLFALTPVNAPGLKTMAVDKHWRVYIDFDHYLNDLFKGEPDADQKRRVYAANDLNHEPWHLLRGHTGRFEMLDSVDADGVVRNAHIWNLAGDVTINQDIKTIVNDDGWFPETVPASPGLTTEEYYKILLAKAKEQQKCKTCDGTGEKPQDQQGQGDQQDGQQGQGHAPGGTQPCDDCNGQGFNSPGGKSITCGSGSGNQQDWELDPALAPTVSESRNEDLVRETAISIQQMAANPKTRGKLPENLRMWAEDHLKPHPVDWRKFLRAQVKKGISSWQKGKADYTYRRPSRRQVNRDIVQPSMHAPRPRVAVAVDSSGSNIHNLSLIASQVEDLMKQANVRGKSLLVFAVDASAKDVRPVSNFKEIKETIMHGGGGTDMRVAYNTIARLHKEGKVDMGVVITDLETPWPSERPANMPFITMGVVGEGADRTVQETQNQIGDWSQLVLIPEADINNQG